MKLYTPTDFSAAWSALSPEEQTRLAALARDRYGIPPEGLKIRPVLDDNGPTTRAALRLILKAMEEERG